MSKPLGIHTLDTLAPYVFILCLNRYMTCFGQWDLNKFDASKALMNAYKLSLVFLEYPIIEVHWHAKQSCV